MTAPTTVYVESTQATATTDLPSSTTVTAPAVGDLCVVMLEGNTTAMPPVTGINYTGGGSASYTSFGSQTGSTTMIVQGYYKILVSGDFSGANLKQITPAGWVNAGGARWQVAIFRPPSGKSFSASDILVATDFNSTNVANGSTACTLTGRTLPGVAVWMMSTASNASSVKWDGGTAAAPYFTGNTGFSDTTGATNYSTDALSRQADFKLYDTGTANITIAGSSQQSNTTHAYGSAFFQIQGAATVNGTAALSGGGTLSASGTPTVNGTAALSVDATLHAEQNGATFGTTDLSAGGTFTVTGTRTTSGTAAAAIVATFTAAGTTPGDIANSGTYSAGGLYVPGGNTWTGTASAAPTVTFAVSGTVLHSGAGLADATTTVAMSASATVTVTGTATLAVTATLHATPERHAAWTFHLMPPGWQFRLMAPQWQMEFA